jgi:hypothetical protein
MDSHPTGKERPGRTKGLTRPPSSTHSDRIDTMGGRCGMSDRNDPVERLDLPVILTTVADPSSRTPHPAPTLGNTVPRTIWGGTLSVSACRSARNERPR